jgi:membrane associated rhomboid family serine protease
MHKILLALTASVSLFIVILSFADRMNWFEALFSGMLGGAISGILMRMARDE